jgi:hypothetical protein
MTLRMNGSISGYTEVTAPAVAGSNTLVLPGGNGTADQALVTDGSGTLSFTDRGRMVLETAKASTSGTEVDFTDIPSWVKRVTVMFNAVSTNGTSGLRVQIGDSGGIETTSYEGVNSVTANSNVTATSAFSAGFDCLGLVAASVVRGSFVLSVFDSTSNTWTATASLSDTNQVRTYNTTGTKTLSATLDRIRVTSGNGTDTFDAGSINLLLEG